MSATATSIRDESFWQRQFRLPAGLFGRVTGWIMARENQRMNRMAVAWVDARPEDDVLEIGFGPGQAIDLLAKRTAARHIAGVDPSPVMLEQAAARNAEAIAGGRVLLVRGTVSELPFGDGAFCKVFAVSNFQIWDDRSKGLAEVRRVLRPGGRLVLCLRRAARHKHFWSSPGVSDRELERDRQQLADAGFGDIRLATRRLGRRIVCLSAVVH